MSRRPAEDRLHVSDLLSQCWTVAAVAEHTGIPTNTVRRWKREMGSSLRLRWRPADAWSYAYLLGMYLGDGCVSQHRGRVLFRVSLDARYPDVIADCGMSMRLSNLEARVTHVRRRGSGAVVVQSCGKDWLLAFPQHGPGRKHERAIRLEPWQSEIVDAHHAQFVRGLIHSDGCRTVNAFTTKLPSGRVAEYAYPRYFFSNLSADIRDLFCTSCNALGVRWTQSNPRNISVAHRRSVAILDEIGCAKE